MKTKQIVLLLGGNIGDTRGYIRNGLTLLEQQLGFLTHLSSFYKTTSWGFDSADFINLAIVIETEKTAEQCLSITQGIEEELGRINHNTKDGYADRSLDIDIIFYDNETIESDTLIIPHPRMHQRNFVLQALLEIIPHFIHPVFNKSIETLANQCKDSLNTLLLNEQV